MIIIIVSNIIVLFKWFLCYILCSFDMIIIIVVMFIVMMLLFVYVFGSVI